MAGRVTVSAGPFPVVVTGMSSTNNVGAFEDADLSAQVFLPVTVPAGAARIFYVEDAASITPTVTDPAGHVLSAVATACRAGKPVNLGPFAYTAASTLA